MRSFLVLVFLYAAAAVALSTSLSASFSTSRRSSSSVKTSSSKRSSSTVKTSSSRRSSSTVKTSSSKRSSSTVKTSSSAIPSPSATSSPSATASPSTTSSPSATDSPSVTSSPTITTSSSATSSPSETPCICTDFSQIAPAVAACTDIVLQDISAPTNSSINLSKLKQNSVVTFAGITTFAFTNISTFDPIIISGKNVTIQGAPGHLIDGNGPIYWDGIGSNGGVPKPNHFLAISKFTLGSVVQNLNIKNWPVHCFSISSTADAIFRNIYLDNSEGNAPNNRSNGLAAGHNSDGFDMSGSNNSIITNSTVINQDDCVAITSGNNITVSDMYCSGGHGISIGSVGGKSNNNVTNILFTDIVVVDSTNGPRIKSNYNTTGFISNITYSNIVLSNIETYGIDIQQDYLNGGPTGDPSNGVIISNLLFENVTGTATSTARDYYVLCGAGSCDNIVFDDVHIVGGGISSFCNYPETGCPA